MLDKTKLDVAKKKIMFVYNQWHTAWTREKFAEVRKIDNATFQHAEDKILEEFTHDELVTYMVNENLRRCDYSSATKADRDTVLVPMRDRLEAIRLGMEATIQLRDEKTKEIIFNNKKKKIRVAIFYAYQALESAVLHDFDVDKLDEILISLKDELDNIQGDEVVTSHPVTSDELNMGIG